MKRAHACRLWCKHVVADDSDAVAIQIHISSFGFFIIFDSVQFSSSLFLLGTCHCDCKCIIKSSSSNVCCHTLRTTENMCEQRVLLKHAQTVYTDDNVACWIKCRMNLMHMNRTKCDGEMGLFHLDRTLHFIEFVKSEPDELHTRKRRVISSSCLHKFVPVKSSRLHSNSKHPSIERRWFSVLVNLQHNA